MTPRADYWWDRAREFLDLKAASTDARTRTQMYDLASLAEEAAIEIQRLEIALYVREIK